tara:strand:+ start:880 stop:3198 length:2319 start_codon:yes stop_codon:yes gene_type:complete
MATPEEIKLQKENNKLQKEYNDILKDRIGISAAEKADGDDFANALQSASKMIKEQTVQKRELLSISNRLTKTSADEFSLLGKELRAKNAGLNIGKKQISLQKDILNLKRLQKQITVTDPEDQSNLNDLILARVDAAKKLNSEYQKQQDILSKIDKSKTIKLLSAGGDIAEKLGLGKLGSFFNEAADEVADVMLENELTKEGKGKRVSTEMGKLKDEDIATLEGDGTGISNDFVKKLKKDKGFDADKILKGNRGAAASKKVGGDLAKGIGKSLKPLGKFTKLLKVAGKFLKGTFILDFILVDKKIGDAAKGMNITYEEARQLSSEMRQVANETGNIFVTSGKVLGNFVALNKILGTTSKTMTAETAQLAADLTAITESSGMTAEEFKGMAMLSLTTGENLNDVTGEFMGAAKAAGIQNGVMVNTKDLAKSMSQLSAATTLSLGKNPALLGEALAVTKALGMEMSQLDGIASSLLDFESSIANELEAELLTGKNLNLEKARQAALNNDLATLAEEIAEQAGNAAEFGAMNRIQQEAIAKAVGMNREELAKTLFTQEAMVGLTGDEAAEQEALLNARIAEVGLAQAQKEMAKDGIEGLKAQASQADRLLAVMDKLNELIIGLVEPMIPFIDMFVDLLGIVGEIVKFMQPVFDFANLLGAGLGDLASSAGSMLAGGEADFSASNKAGARFESNLGYEGYYTNLSKEGDGGNFMADGGILKSRVDNITAGEAGPEAIVPLPAKGIAVDNSKMESILSNIDKHLSGLNNAPLYTINRG